MRGSVSFTEKAAEYGLDNAERTRHATFIDYNKDGYLDLFLLNQPPNPGNYSAFHGAQLLTEEWAPRLYKNNGNTIFQLPQSNSLNDAKKIRTYVLHY